MNAKPNTLEPDWKTVANLLRQAIVTHHAQKADDRCFLDDDKLYVAAGLPPCDRRVGDKAAMLENCKRFLALRCESGGWVSYKDLESELERAAEAIDALLIFAHQFTQTPFYREAAVLEAIRRVLKGWEQHGSGPLTEARVVKLLFSLGEWFDSPSKSPLIRTRAGTPGMALREIASELEKTAAARGEQPANKSSQDTVAPRPEAR